MMNLVCVILIGLCIGLSYKLYKSNAKYMYISSKVICIKERFESMKEELKLAQKQVFDLENNNHDLFASAAHIGCLEDDIYDIEKLGDFNFRNDYILRTLEACEEIIKTQKDEISKLHEIEELYNKVWEEQARETQVILDDVLSKIQDELDELAPNNNNVGLGFENKTVINNGSYGFTNEGDTITYEKILISPIVVFDDSEKRLMDYYSNTFGLNLAYDARTARIVTFLHEIGHMVDYNNRTDVKNYSNMNQELKAQLLDYETQEESDYAYRQVPCEYAADKFAIEMLKKYYPELAYGER